MIKEEVKKTVNYKNYKVVIDSSNYTLYKITKVKDGKREGEDALPLLGYYSSMDGAIEKMIEDSVNSNKKTVELKEYLAEYIRIKDEFVTAIKV